MRIAFVTGCFPKLSETFVLDQITGLIELGHDVKIFAFEQGNEPVRHAAIERYRLLDRMTVLDRRPRSTLRGAIASLPELASWLGALRYPSELETRLSHGSQGAFGVIYCHFGHVAERARRLRRAGFFTGPLVAVFHAYDLAIWPRLQEAGAYAKLFAEAERLLPIAEHWTKRLVALGADARKIEVRRLGVDLETCVFRQRTLDVRETLQLVSVGRLVEKKGFAVAIEALARVRPRLRRSIAYHIVGEGPLGAELEALARSRGLDEVVTFHGALSRENLASLLESMHVLVAPSVTGSDGDTEGLPVVLLEAMARGLPVVTSAHAGIPELVRDGKTGWLVAEGDVERLGSALLDVERAPERWSEVCRAARKVVEDRHDARKLTRELAALFETLSVPGNSNDR